MPSMWNWATDRAIIKYTWRIQGGELRGPLVRPHHALVPGNDNVLPE
jgi:hypothetical protein